VFHVFHVFPRTAALAIGRIDRKGERTCWYPSVSSVCTCSSAIVLTCSLVFAHMWMGQRFLRAYDADRQCGETRSCFLRIIPDPAISTYMLGSNLLDLTRPMESGAGSVKPPASSPASQE
jgi:hypothetical protein